MKKWILLVAVGIITGCASNEDKKLRFALDYAGKNRAELEKVLSHYKDDAMKLKAARFLIGNMPGHYSLVESGVLTNYYDMLDSLLLNTPINDYRDSKRIEHLMDTAAPKHVDINALSVPDAQVITSAYLIDNIDRAFDLWKNQPWAQHLGFNDFCEYLLPYQVGNSFVMEDWRTLVYDHIDQSIKDELKTFPNSSELRNSAYHACIIINKYLRKTICPDGSSLKSPGVYRLSTLAKVPYGTCADRTYVAEAVMRSFGIPISIDFTYQWPFRSVGHTWNILLMMNGQNVCFGGGENGPGELHLPGQRMAKASRRTYAMNDDILALKAEMGTVPPAFQNIFAKDVTEEYMRPWDIEVPVKWKQGNPKYAYLAVFDDKEWIPVCYGKKKGNGYRFEKIGNDVVYLPVYYSKEGMRPFSDPFILDLKGDIHYLPVDEIATQDAELYRKFGLSKVMYDYAMNLTGGEIQASATADFAQPVTVKEITKWSTISDSVTLEKPLSYRYWRYVGSPGSNNIANLAFYEAGSHALVKGMVIGTDETYFPGDTVYTKHAVFDGDPLTYYEAPDSIPNPWVGMDFGKPVSLEKVVYMPRNDDNNIRPGDLYELFYWKKDGWISLGRQTGVPPCLIYKAVPGKALFLLRDLTRGKEERIFTYENGKQMWW